MNQLVTVFCNSDELSKYIVWEFANNGYNVNVVVDDIKKANYMKSYGLPGRISIVTGDIVNYTQITSFIKISDIVVNCFDLKIGNKKYLNLVNSFFPDFLAECAAKYNIKKYIHISSISAELDSKSSYGAMKKNAENNIIEKAKHCSTILRIGNLISNESKYISCICQFANLPFIVLPKSIKNNFLYLTNAIDIAKSIINTVNDNKTNGKIYNLVNQEINQLDFVKSILTTVNKNPKIVFIPNKLSKIKYSFMQKIPSDFLCFASQILYSSDIVNSNKINVNMFEKLGIKSLNWNEYSEKICLRNEDFGIYDENIDIKNYY
ncbi:Rossmann-fold NAD(P)-binding domain-containing protein [Candidatus Deianiraea vastatrix]|uniref:NAD(P)H-binding protein n=1 Tax=Candidatus Deianiraea vastatrix TaxID=2163644 RepID=A0A5B8XG24_9RICK|nr:hypothetical protein [Candidatus Deianiraea vastatrix]QED23284.1 Putative NAD(P)H-binding protein [Candidatus Deianiraea vastatrix]